MRKTLALFMAGFVFAADGLPAQSLADAARKEAERRKALEKQGIPSKTIIQKGLPQLSTAAEKPTGPRAPATGGKRLSATHYRTALERLQNDIARTRERLDAARKRFEAERSMPFRLGRNGSQTGSSLNQQKIQVQLQELESRLSRLQEERRKTYDEGRKAGYLPGELDGKGITP
jgi:hypothetical protein